jgi:Solute carrier family 12
MKPNTVLLGWPKTTQKAETFGATLRLVTRLQRSIIAARLLETEEPDEELAIVDTDEAWEVPSGTIDVWWRGRQNGALMMLLAHLLHQNPDWRRNSIRVIRIVPKPEAQEEVRRSILDMATASRIRVEPVVIVSDDVTAAIQSASRSASVVFFGFETPEEGEEQAFFERMESIAGGLPRVLFVSSAGGVELES